MIQDEKYFYDDNFGISIEEQKEILSKINDISEKNRRSLTASSDNTETIAVNAKKKGYFFPVIVNAAALLIIAAGCFILFYVNQRRDISIRQGSGSYDVTERALIEEIRRETAEKLELKDMEIAAITSQLDEVDAMLLQLFSGNNELTAEQITARDALLESRNTYRIDLAFLRDERSRILEESRLREASLRYQFEERAGEHNVNAAEIQRLNAEQETASAIDAQFAGSLSVISSFIERGEYENASNAAGELKNFLETPAFQINRSFQARKDIYTRSIEAFEKIINEILSGEIPVREIVADTSSPENITDELQEKIVQLETSIAQMQRTINSFSSGNQGQAARLAELEETISSLNRENSEKDRTISSLQSDNATLTQTITARDSSIRELESANSSQQQEITNLRNQIAIIRQALQD